MVMKQVLVMKVDLLQVANTETQNHLNLSWKQSKKQDMFQVNKFS